MRKEALLVAAAALLLARGARAEVDFKFNAAISSDVRFRINGAELPAPDQTPFQLPYPAQYRLLKNGFSRNENLIKVGAKLSISNKVQAVADVDFYTYGYSDIKEIDNLTLRERVDPYRFEANSAYIDIYNILPRLDLRVGRQVVVWGAADKFNPTANVSPLDFSDPLLFGKALGNNMLRADWNPIGDWTITGVVVPIFRPNQLPRSAPIALLDPTRPLSVQDDSVQRSVTILTPPPAGISSLTAAPVIPEVSLNNVQYALRVAGRVLDQDVSLSYYHGRFAFPVPSLGIVTSNGPKYDVEIGLVYPRMDVLGFDIAGTIPKLAGMGYWIEGAVIFPQEVTYALYKDAGMLHQEERFTPVAWDPESPRAAKAEPWDIGGSGNYLKTPPGMRPLINSTQPFAKLTIGGDLSIGSHVYVNIQYVHGFFDEFGAGWNFRRGWDSAAKDYLDPLSPRKEQRIGDYIVGGIDVKLLSDTLLLRLFTVWKLPSLDWFGTWKFDDYLFTAVVFPQLAWQVWDGTELTLGGLAFLGGPTTKFGDPSTGASEVFLRVRFNY